MSTSTCNPSRVYITSQDRDLGQNPANFSVTLPSTIENAQSFEIVSFAFPNVFYNFNESTSVLYISVDAAGTREFFAVNLGTEPLNPASLPSLAAGQGSTSGFYQVVFPNGLQAGGILNPAQNFSTSFFANPPAVTGATRVPLTRLYIGSVAELASYLQLIFNSVLSANTDIVDNTGANAGAPVYNLWGAGAWNVAALNGAGTSSAGSQQSLSIWNTTGGNTTIQLPAVVTNSGAILPRQAARKMGFTDLVDTVVPLTQVAFEQGDAPVNLLATQDVQVTSSLTAAEALSSNGRRDILFKVPLTTPVGGIQQQQATLSGTAESKIPNNIRSVEIVLLDDDFQPLQLPDNAVTSAEIHFIFTNRPAAQNAVSLR